MRRLIKKKNAAAAVAVAVAAAEVVVVVRNFQKSDLYSNWRGMHTVK